MKKDKTRAKMLVRAKQDANNVYQLFIYDEVTDEGSFNWAKWEYVDSTTSADYFREQLAAIPDNATIELFINSHGGYVDEGTAIYNQLKRHKAYKVGYVDGVAYSVAALILMACDHIVVGLGTTVLVHNMWTVAVGNAEDLRKVADDLDKMMESNRQVFMQRFKGSEDELIALMAEERPLTPNECLELGFCDELGEVVEHKDLEKKDDENPDDEPDDKEKQVSQMLQAYIKQMSQNADRITQAVQSFESSLIPVPDVSREAGKPNQRANPEPKEPEGNKCINFFNQFLEEESE